MDLLSAFSFGKIIKTFVPGVIALGLPMFASELVHFATLPDGYSLTPEAMWAFYLDKSFIFGGDIKTGEIALIGISLVPTALILGFLCNTIFWFFCHSFCWTRIEGHQDDEYHRLRAHLENLAIRATRRLLGPTAAPKKLPQLYLPGFLLPILDFTKWSYVRESYFSWYEFHLNAVFAILLAFLSYLAFWIYLAVRWSLGGDWVLTLAVPCSLIFAVAGLLVSSALRNLKVFQQRSLWFFLGTLVFDTAGASALLPRPEQLSLWSEWVHGADVGDTSALCPGD
jgi:hypothetical protein